MEPGDCMAFVEFRNVGKRYQMGEVSIEALHDVSFSVEKGEICVIVGASGAGKTTLLNILGGMDSLTSGSVHLGGKKISNYSSRKLTQYRRCDIGFVFQFYNLMPNLSALENIELAASLSDDPLDSKEVLASVGLEKRANNFPSQLSGGEQQRIAIARAVLRPGGILLLDEATSSLDPQTESILMENLRALPLTVIFVSHREAVMAGADQLLRLEA